MYACRMFPNADVAPASEKAPFEVEVYNIANESHQQGHGNFGRDVRVEVTGDCGTAAVWKEWLENGMIERCRGET